MSRKGRLYIVEVRSGACARLTGHEPRPRGSRGQQTHVNPHPPASRARGAAGGCRERVLSREGHSRPQGLGGSGHISAGPIPAANLQKPFLPVPSEGLFHPGVQWDPGLPPQPFPHLGRGARPRRLGHFESFVAAEHRALPRPLHGVLRNAAHQAKKAVGDRVVADEDLSLWEALRACRLSLASEHDVPAFVIFHDKTLHEMIAYRPQTTAEMLGISGVGQTKLDRYGDRFLSVLRDEPPA